jgi:hypothetical protein
MTNEWNTNAWDNTAKAAAKATENAWGNAPQQQQTQGGSIWDNFEEIDTTPQRNGYIPPNLDCDVEIVEMKVIQSIKNNNRPIFIATVQTLEEAPARYDWVAKADERPYLQNIKALICGLNPNGDPRSFGRAVMEELTGPTQPARGKRVHLRSEQIMTRSGNEFTKCHWSASRS